MQAHGMGKAILLGQTLAIFFGLSSSAAAQEPVARFIGGGALLLQPDRGTDFEIAQRGANIPPRALLIGVPSGLLESANRAVRLNLAVDLGDVSPLPILETAVRLQVPGQRDPKADLVVDMERGRIELSNHQPRGGALVKVRFGYKPTRQPGKYDRYVWDINLTEPGSRVVLELYGRWQQGVRFQETPNPDQVPATEMVLLVTQGTVTVETDRLAFAMLPPPGPAYFHWDSVLGADASPRRLQRLPDWAEPNAESAEVQPGLRAALQKLGKQLENSRLEPSLKRMIRSDQAAERRVGVVLTAAVDQLPLVIQALENPRHADLRTAAVNALLHWIGREPGQDTRLFQAVQQTGFSRPQATTLLRLLYPFDAMDLVRDATYETLIDLLAAERMALRVLAQWHLLRLLPQGKGIMYDPAGSAEERQAAIAQWRKLFAETNLRRPNRGS